MRYAILLALLALLLCACGKQEGGDHPEHVQTLEETPAQTLPVPPCDGARDLALVCRLSPTTIGALEAI